MAPNTNPRVVAIGASAGGLDAFTKLIENLPKDTDMTFVLLSHLLKGFDSLLPEIISKATPMPVIEVTKDIHLVKNTVYVLPAGSFMEIHDGTVHLVPRPAEPINTAINHFILSLAKDSARGSIGIILSGEGSDGAEGIKILKEEAGGITMAQSPDTASSQSMPLNAIKIDHVDYVLSPKDIALKLVSMSNQDWTDQNSSDSSNKNGNVKVLWMKDHRARH